MFITLTGPTVSGVEPQQYGADRTEHRHPDVDPETEYTTSSDLALTQDPFSHDGLCLNFGLCQR